MSQKGRRKQFKKECYLSIISLSYTLYIVNDQGLYKRLKYYTDLKDFFKEYKEELLKN